MSSTPTVTGSLPIRLQDPDEKEIEQKMIKAILGMPKDLQDRFKALHMLSDQRSVINDQYNESVNKIESQIREETAPLLLERKQIISGEKTEFASYLPKFEESFKELEKKIESNPDLAKPPINEKKPMDLAYLKGKTGVPEFWIRAMEMNGTIWDTVNEKDDEVLEKLLHVETSSSETEVTKNYVLTLKMFFEKDNGFFKPEVLEVSVEYASQDKVKEIKGTVIEWVEGKDPTKKKIKKKQKNKKTGETRQILKSVDCPSFFNIFKSLKPIDQDDGDSEEENKVEDQIDDTMAICEEFDDVLIPHALNYFLGFEGNDPESEDSGEDSDASGDDSGSDSPVEKKKKK